MHLRDDKPNIVMPNMWAGLGGTIDPGETPEQAAFRELQEEIEFTPSALYYLKCYVLPDRDVHLFYCYIDVEDPSTIPLHEGVRLEYFSFEEVIALADNGKTAPLMKEIVIAINARLQERPSS